MKIIKKRIYSLNNNLPKNFFGKTIIPAIILDANLDKKTIVNLGFTETMAIGERILPMPVGPVSKFNSDGREIPDKTKSKETKYREIEWCWDQWAGRDRTERVCDFRMVPYKRWQRIFIDPPAIELTIAKRENDKIYITTPNTIVSEKDQTDALHKINLILDIFGACDVLDENQAPIINTTKNLNWTILPSGKRPWLEQKKLIQPFIDLVKNRQVKPVVESRFEDINKLQPEFTAVGNQGFSGYIVFGFPVKNIYILESAFYGNAIYVFSENWENLSRKTKAEIINASLQVDRITHNGERTNWLKKLRDLLK